MIEKTFNEYLRNAHTEQGDAPDTFEQWLETLDTEEIIMLADEYAYRREKAATNA